MEAEKTITNRLIWLPVVGYEGLYEVSDFGNIKSLSRIVRHPNGGDLQTTEKIMKAIISTTGKYCQINLYRNNKMKVFKIHRLVGLAFIKNIHNKPFINHIDGNKQNNHISNLEWCTAKENIIHAFDNNLMNVPHGEKHVRAKLTSKDVLKIRDDFKIGVKQNYLANKYSVCKQTINNICHNKIWKHVK